MASSGEETHFPKRISNIALEIPVAKLTFRESLIHYHFASKYSFQIFIVKLPVVFFEAHEC
jgi:hypothetical protein